MQTHSIDDLKLLPIARVDDVKIDAPFENYGMGSMLVGEAIKECERLGNKGIHGYLSDADKDHFPKLKHFYEKLGFSVVFYSEDHPDYQIARAGKVEMDFDNVQKETE